MPKRLIGILAVLATLSVVVLIAGNSQGVPVARADPTGPQNQTPPSVPGTPNEGAAVTADPGTWSDSPTSYGYQWLSCTTSCSPATGSGATSQTYTPDAGDVGNTLEVTVTATAADASQGTATSGPSATVTDTPVNQTLPSIPGTPLEGTAVTADPGTWSNSPTSYGYQWLSCTTSCSPATGGGATSQTYTPAAADVGHTLEVTVTATAADGGQGTATSGPSAKVASDAPVNQTLPSVPGTPQEGTAVTADPGTWSNNPTSYDYQWLSCTSPTSCPDASGSGATSQTYTPNAADVGNALEVTVTAHNADNQGVATSQPSATVLPAPCGAQCYTTPSPGAHADCSSGNPCALQTAVTVAVSGDTIELAGTYDVGSTISDSGKALSFVGGGYGQTLLQGGLPGDESVVSLGTGGSSIQGVKVQNLDSTGVALSLGAPGGAITANQVFATGVGQACQLNGGVTLTDSVCSSSGSGLTVLGTQGSNTLRNDDIWGADDLYGAYAAAGSGDVLTNTIVSAGASGSTDLYAAQDGSINATYSSFATTNSDGSITTNSTDESTPADLVNPAGGDFQEEPGSPTVAAGTDSPADGSFDLDGNPRATATIVYFSYGLTPAVGTETPTQSFTTTDIGAEQIQARPIAALIGASAIGENSATLGGKFFVGGVNPNSLNTGHSEAAPVSGLSVGGTYYFELVASDPTGSYTSGQDLFMTGTQATNGIGIDKGPTGGGGGPGPPLTSIGPLVGTAAVTVASARVSRNSALLAVVCAGSTSCVGKLELGATKTVKVKVKKGKKGKKGKNAKTGTKVEIIVVARASYSVAANATATATLKLTAAGKKLIAAERGKVVGYLEITPNGVGAVTSEQRLTLTAPVKAAKKKKKTT